jgi:hypothetical protein
MRASTTLVLTIIWGGVTYSWGSGRIIGIFVASGVLFIMLGIQQVWALFTTPSGASSQSNSSAKGPLLFFSPPRRHPALLPSFPCTLFLSSFSSHETTMRWTLAYDCCP